MSTEEARRHLSDLLEDRKVLAQEINTLKQQMEEGHRPAAKIRVRMNILCPTLLGLKNIKMIPYKIYNVKNCYLVDLFFLSPLSQRRTLIISELENQGALETPLNKQVENLETEIGLRLETEQIPLQITWERRWRFQQLSGSEVMVEWCVTGTLRSLTFNRKSSLLTVRAVSNSASMASQALWRQSALLRS